MVIRDEDSRTEGSSAKKSIAHLVIGFVILAFMGHDIPKRVVLSLSNSVGHRVFYYQKTPDPSQIHKGDFVVFDIETDLIPNCNPCRIVKKVGCVEGEELNRTQDGAYFCGQMFLGMAKEKTRKGIRLHAFDYSGKVPPQCIFASSGHKDGYDSRYIGFVRKEAIQGKAIPIL